MRKDNPNPFYLDCQSAALLALTQAARIMHDSRLPEIIERGIAAYRLAPQAIDLGTGGRIDTVGIASPDAAGEIGETAFWNFKAGLTLRFFGALRRSPNAAVQAIASRHRDRLAVFDTVLRRQLAQAAVEHCGCIEFRTSVVSGETNSETQPWVMLGLLGHPFD
jgi:hypothetical protein